VARTHTKMIARKRVEVVRARGVRGGASLVARKIVAVRRLIRRIFAYSAIKIKANLPALYSTLKPETSSDSPSAKSKGVRLVSARIEVNHMMNKGSRRSIFGAVEVKRIVEKSNEEWRIRGEMRMRAILTS
jgi:hypothetical protein